jgi:hypothetical protein
MGQQSIATVVKHDEGFNAKSCNYIRISWVMFLAFPLDFQKDIYIRAAVAPYGRLLKWYRDANKSRIVVQVMLLSPDRVPRSLIVSRGTLIGGAGHSWAVPVYILNGHIPDAFPADEDPVPIDGEPHPEHPPIALGPHQIDPNCEEEQQGTTQILGVFGGNPHPDGANAEIQIEDDNMQVDDQADQDDDSQWPAWDPIIFVGNNHPRQPA